MDLVQGIREAALQPHAVERLGRRRKLQDHGQARLRRVGRRYRAFDLAARRRRAAAQRPWRQLALFRKRYHHLGANSRDLRSAGADAAVGYSLLSARPNQRGSRRSRSFATLMMSAQTFSDTRFDNSRVKRASCSCAVNGREALPLGAGTKIDSLRPSRNATLTRAAVERSLLAASTSPSKSIAVRSSSSNRLRSASAA